VDFPTIGQQYRAEHFWATISKVDERGYREGLHMEMVHGVSSAIGLWHKARIQVQGDEIRVWVDGRPVTAVHDATYPGPGRIGLATYSGYGETANSCYRNLRIRGRLWVRPRGTKACGPRATGASWTPITARAAGRESFVPPTAIFWSWPPAGSGVQATTGKLGPATSHWPNHREVVRCLPLRTAGSRCI